MNRPASPTCSRRRAPIPAAFTTSSRPSRTCCSKCCAAIAAPAWEGVDDPIERVFALLAAYRGALAGTDCLYGCPIGSLALELHEPDPPVRELIAINFDGWVDAIERCYVDAGARLPRDLDRRALAVFTLTTMEGGVMQSRTQRNLRAFDQSVAMLRDYVTRLEQETKGRGKT